MLKGGVLSLSNDLALEVHASGVNITPHPIEVRRLERHLSDGSLELRAAGHFRKICSPLKLMAT